MKALLAVVLVASAASGAAATPYLQYQADAGRTGATDDPGPEWPDHAFSVELPGAPAYLSGPLVLDGGVFVLVSSRDQPGVYRIDLATAGVQRVVELPANGSALASDGMHLFVAGPHAVEAHGLDGGDPVWSWAFPAIALGEAVTRCAPLAVDVASVVAACSQGSSLAGARPGGSPLGTPGPQSFVAALDPATGEPQWTWIWPHTQCAGVGGVLPQQCAPDRPAVVLATSLAMSTDLIVVAGHERNTVDPQSTLLAAEIEETIEVRALDRRDGAQLWARSWEAVASFVDVGATPAPAFNVPTPGLIATSDTIYVGTGDLHALSAENGATTWTRRLAPFDSDRAAALPNAYRSGVLGLAGTRLVASGIQQIVAYELAVGEPQGELWRAGIAEDMDQMHAILQTGEAVYVNTFSHHVAALDPSSGRVQWIDQVTPGNNGVRTAVGDGILVAAAPGGIVVVIGHTPASIQVSTGPLDRFPRPGEAFRVDLGGSAAGVAGAPTQFSVEWGDGSAAPWQESPRFEHAYSDIGRREVRFMARNEAGQSASTVAVVDVGAAAPNVVSAAFSPENQDLTFGVLGIILALLGALFAAWRRWRGRGRFQQELAAIEAAYARTRDRPRDCEAALAERRAHVQGSLLDGRLDEAQGALLTRRIDDLARDLRLGTLDRRFHFLPYGFVMSLKEMLADGVLSTWERDHLERAIESDRTMTPDQKANVRTLLAEWVQADAGGRA